MKELNVTALKLALSQIDVLNKQHEQQISPLKKIKYDFIKEIEDWFGTFILDDPKVSEDLWNYYHDQYSDVSIENDKVVFVVGEYFDDCSFEQHFRCEVPLDEIVDVVNNKKSLWDYKHDTKIQYI